MADPFTPYLPGQEVAKSIGESFIPEYLKNPNVHGVAPNAEWKTPRSQPDNPLPWLGLDLASMIPGGAAKGASSLAAKLAALKLIPRSKTQVGTYHSILNDAGEVVGNVHIGDKNPKHLDIRSISSEIGPPGSFGTSEIRSLVKALKQTYPEAEKVSGMRSSGARYGPARTELSHGPVFTEMKLK